MRLIRSCNLQLLDPGPWRRCSLIRLFRQFRVVLAIRDRLLGLQVPGVLRGQKARSVRPDLEVQLGQEAPSGLPVLRGPLGPWDLVFQSRCRSLRVPEGPGFLEGLAGPERPLDLL